MLLLAAALVMSTVATTLVAAVPLYSEAIIEAGLRSALAEAPPSESGLEATFRSDAVSWMRTTDRLDALAASRLPGEQRALVAARTDTYSLPAELLAGREGWITSIASIDSVADAELLRDVDGPRRASGPDVLAARLHVDAAAALGLAPGDRIELVRRGVPPVIVELVGTVEPRDPTDRLWFDQPDLRDGLVVDGSFTDVGPFLVDPASLSAIGGTANYRWRIIVDPDSVDTGDLARLEQGASGVEQAISDRLDAVDVVVTTQLPALVGTTDTAIGSTAAVIATILLQLVGVALYGVGLSASVLATSRAAETSMLRSRGATPAQLGAMAATEAVLVALPAIALGPWLGGRVVELVQRWGPVSATGLDLQPTVSATAVIATVIVGTLVVAIVAWPAVRAARGFARELSERGRQDGQLGVQRAGLDLGVAALAVLGLWRLRGSSAATSDLAGRLGTDPVLVLAPTLGVIAASLLTLRLIAFVAAGAQRATSSPGALSLAMAGWELARRPGRTARTTVLIVLSVTVGTFASVHGASWQRSQRDQADAGVSADLVVTPDARPSAVLGAPFVPDAYRALEGVASVVPVDRSTATLTAELGTVPVVAAGTDHVDEVLRLRSDLYGAGGPARFATLHQPGDIGAVELGETGDSLTLELDLVAEPSAAVGDVRVAVVLIDGYGTPVRVAAQGVAIDAERGTLTFPLATDVAGRSRRLTGPLRLVELEVAVPSVRDTRFNEQPLDAASFELALHDARLDDRPVELVAPWTLGSLTLGSQLAAPSASIARAGSGVAVRIDSGRTEQTSGSAIARFGTAEFGRGDGFEVPVFVTPALLAALELEVGDAATARILGTPVELRIADTVPVAPFAVDEPMAIVADWETLGIDRWSRSRRVEAPDAWALDAGPPTEESLTRLLLGPPYASESVIGRRQEARELSRAPVTVGLSGSLGLALGASLVVAAIGLVLTAVVGARERRPAFAILRAMGTRASELRRWLLLETVPLVGFSAAVGLVSGVALARLALPSLAVASDGTRAVPGPALVVPWGTLGIVVAIAMAAGMALPIVTARLLRRHRTADELRIGDTT